MGNDILTEIQFINHASVLVKHGESAILTDPWYFGSAFHDGWNLMYENTELEIDNVLKITTHIWISHEHPDHFSIGFFKKYKSIILERGIKLLFQKTEDKRVLGFLNSLMVPVLELSFNEKIKVADGIWVTCIKDGFYDSGLFIETSDLNVLNLNDCEVRSHQRAAEIKRYVKQVDVLLTQFSYAAWKGNKDNFQWRREAAFEKIEILELQIKAFEPKYIIPFASFIYFSNKANYYLNDSSNTLNDVLKKIEPYDQYEVICMKPGDKFCQALLPWNNESALKFWQENGANEAFLNSYTSVPLQDLMEAFEGYIQRIYSNNSKFMINILRYISPLPVFRPVILHLMDLDKKFEIDLVKESFRLVDQPADLELHSESLFFLFKNTFGFDTLTVNGCFQEGKTGGFVRATKSLAIENLNNIGVLVKWSTIFNVRLILMFFTRLYRVARKLED
jgi:UDP-MurNAc hydroxylase